MTARDRLAAWPRWSQEFDSFERYLLAQNRSPQTIRTYRESVLALTRYLGDAWPDPFAVTRADIERFFGETLRARTPRTAITYYRGLRCYYRYLTEELEPEAINPMARVRSPRLPDDTAPVLTEAQIQALLKACAGSDFEARRDLAIMRLFLDTGMRRRELAALRMGDVDFQLNTAVVLGKGSKVRVCPFGRKTALALDRYLRVRARHKDAALDALWIGKQGELGTERVSRIMGERAEQAGVAGIHSHLFRHTFAHLWLEAGGQEGDLMMLGGWTSRETMGRYAKRLAADRAREAHRRLSLGDRF